jgi:hypothetical protein
MTDALGPSSVSYDDPQSVITLRAAVWDETALRLAFPSVDAVGPVLQLSSIAVPICCCQICWHTRQACRADVTAGSTGIDGRRKDLH